MFKVVKILVSSYISFLTGNITVLKQAAYVEDVVYKLIKMKALRNYLDLLRHYNLLVHTHVTIFFLYKIICECMKH